MKTNSKRLDANLKGLWQIEYRNKHTNDHYLLWPKCIGQSLSQKEAQILLLACENQYPERKFRIKPKYHQKPRLKLPEPQQLIKIDESNFYY